VDLAASAGVGHGPRTAGLTVLVTGGAGYVGSHVVHKLRSAGRAVVVLDSLEHGQRASVIDAEFVEGDVRDFGLVTRVLAEYDVAAIVHLAGYKAPGESMVDPGKFFDNNVAGSLSLLRAVDRTKPSPLVFSSSCAVYGAPNSLPVDETQPLSPNSPYGESKRMVEQMLGWFDRCRGIRSVSLRYFNAAGASLDGRIGEHWTATTNLVPLAMRAVLGGSGERLRVFGTDYPTSDGSAVRDYVHVEDLADAHCRALSYLESGGASDVINLGTGTPASVLEVLDEVARHAGRPVPVEHVGRRPGDPAVVWANAARAEAVLGWRAQFGLADTVASAWRWHAQHTAEPGSCCRV